MVGGTFLLCLARWLNQSLSRRLTVIYGVCMAFAPVCVMFTIYVYTTGNLRRTNERNAQRQLALLAAELEGRLKIAESSTQAVAAYQVLHGSAVVKNFDNYTLRLLKEFPEDICFGVYFAYENLPYSDKYACPGADRRSGTTATLEYDYHKDCEWYEKPKNSHRLSYSEPYYDAGGSNVTMVSVTMPVYTKQGKFVGVAGTDVSLEAMQKMLIQVHLFRSTQKAVSLGVV